MPNFKAKYVNLPKLPFHKDKLSIYWQFSSDSIKYLYCAYGGDKFIVRIIEKNGEFLVKGDKSAMPFCLTCLQAMLLQILEFSSKVSSKATSLPKNPSFLPSKLLALDVKSIEDRINNTKACKALNHTDLYTQLGCENIATNKRRFDEVFIEIGFGSGRHLLHLAKANPNTLIIGFEIFDPAIIQVGNLAKDLDNVVLCKYDARAVFEIFSPSVANKVFLHFPVPWDKSPSRRVLSKKFVKNLTKVLKPGGSFELRTDSLNYLEFAKCCFKDTFFAKKEELLNTPAAIISKYEDRWQRQKKDIFDYKLINQKSTNWDEFVQPCGDFSFNETFLIKQIKLKFKPIIIREKDYFMRLEDIFAKDEASLVIRLSLGDYDYPYHGYVVLSDHHLEYLVRKPLPTKTNLAAHKRLCVLLKNASFEHTSSKEEEYDKD